MSYLLNELNCDQWPKLLATEVEISLRARTIHAMTVALVAGLLLSQATSSLPETSVSLSFPGALVGDVLPKLSAAAGVKLDMGDNMGRHFLAIHVSDARLSDVMEEIADVTVGRWVKSADGWRLIEDRDRLQKLRDESRTQKRQAVRQGKEAILDLTDPKRFQATIPAQFKDEFEDFFTHSPEELLMYSLLSRIPENIFVDLNGGERRVFAANPTRMQLQLPSGDYAPLINQWIAEHNASSEEDDDEVPGHLQRLRESRGYHKGPITTASKVLLFLEGSDESTGQATLCVYDTDGNVVLSTYGSLDNYYSYVDYGRGTLERLQREDRGETSGPRPQAEGVTPEPLDDTPIERSEEMLTLLDGMYLGSSEGGLPPEADQAKAIVMRPDIYDPVGLFSGERLIFVAKTKGINLVANLIDGEMGYGVFDVDTQPMDAPDDDSETVGDVRAEFELDIETYVSVRTPEWWTIRPRDIDHAVRTRVDRHDLAKLFQQTNGKIVPELDVIADFAAYNPSLDDTVYASYLSDFFPWLDDVLDYGTVFSNDAWPQLRFYGRLTPGQRTAVKAGHPVEGVGLSADARAALADMIYINPGRLDPLPTLRPAVEPGEELFIDWYIDEESAEPMRDGLRLEPTEAAPNGVPRELTIHTNVITEPYIVEVDQHGKPFARTAPMVAREIVISETLFSTPEDMAEPEYHAMNWLTGIRRTINVRVELSPSACLTFILVDQQQPSKDKTYSFVNPPAEMAAEIRRLEELYRTTSWYRYYREQTMDDGY